MTNQRDMSKTPLLSILCILPACVLVLGVCNPTPAAPLGGLRAATVQQPGALMLTADNTAPATQPQQNGPATTGQITNGARPNGQKTNGALPTSPAAPAQANGAMPATQQNGLPPADNELGLLAAPDTSMGCSGLKCSSPLGDCEGGICGPSGRIWIRADYLAWWTSGTHVIPLVTTSPYGTPQSEAGVLGYPNTSILFGDQTINTEGRSGWRLIAGYWLDACQTWAVQGDYWDFGGLSTHYERSSTATGDPIIARPFFDVNPATGVAREASQLVSYPNLVAGSITVDARDYFQSAGFTLRRLVCWGANCPVINRAAACDPCATNCCRVDFLAGYRYYRLVDDITIRERINGLAGGPLAGITLDVFDGFRTLNEFHGGELGLSVTTYRGRWSLEMIAKMALGNNRQVANVYGSTLVTQNNQSITRLGGLYALGPGPDGYPGNIGTYYRDDFVVIPHLGLDLGYQLTCHLRVFFGYNFIYWATVARASDQIDRHVDSARIPGNGATHNPDQQFPEFNFRHTSFWAHGMNVGLEFRY